MTRLQRIALQRAKVQEAIGLLKAVGEMFGTEDYGQAASDGAKDFEMWTRQCEDFENWVFSESPIA